MPQVSVLMAVYNASPFLQKTLDSLLAQSFQDYEIVAIDDGSTDDSRAILDNLGDPRLRVYHQTNAGQTNALNAGLQLVKGEYIARIDADDVAESERLACQAKFLDTHSQVGLVGSDYVDIDENGIVIRRIHTPTTDRALRNLMGKRNPFVHSAVMFRRSLIDQIGGYIQDSRYPQFQDFDLWVRMATRMQIASLPLSLVRRRVHTSSISAHADAARLRYEIHVRTQAIRFLHLSPLLWIYVLMPMVALRLPPSWRNQIRKWSGHPTI